MCIYESLFFNFIIKLHLTTQDIRWTRYTFDTPPAEFERTSTAGGCPESGMNCADRAILGDGDYGTPALNVTAVHAWDKTVRITFHFPSKVRVTGINLYFYNIPSRNIGLPYVTYLTSSPSFIEGNQDLSQNDNQLRNVTLIPSATINNHLRFSIKFIFSDIDKIDWLLLTEVELCTSGILYSIQRIIGNISNFNVPIF